MTVRKLQQRRGWAFSLGVGIIKPLLLATTTHDWRHGKRIPASGGCVLAMNHISHLDPLTAAHIVYDHGRLPRYLAKSGLFQNAFLRRFLTAAGQIPVEREGKGAVAYAAAVEAVRRGECVVVYPEGTITRDPDMWPMTGKSGAARIGLETGAPVLPRPAAASSRTSFFQMEKSSCRSRSSQSSLSTPLMRERGTGEPTSLTGGIPARGVRLHC